MRCAHPANQGKETGVLRCHIAPLSTDWLLVPSSLIGPWQAQLIEVQKLLSRHGVNTSSYGREGWVTVTSIKCLCSELHT